MKEFILKYKSDIYCILGLLAVFLVCSIVSWGTFGALYYDCGRELILPQWILEGKLLFKDIFGMYLPLPYYFNAIFVKIFGSSITLFQILGVINTIVIIIAIYSIMRNFTSKYFSFAMSLFIIFFYILRSTTCINYIFPYAYPMIYALSAMLISLLFGLKYIETDKNLYINLAFLMLGISVANKPEFLFCIIPLILVTVLSRNNSLKLCVLNTILFMLPTVLSFGILILQGFNVDDFKNYYAFLQKFFNTDEQKYYTAHFVKLPITKTCILAIVKSFLTCVATIILSVMTFKFIALKKFRLFGIFLLPCLILLLLYLNKVLTVGIYEPLNWLGIATSIITVTSFISKNKKLSFLSLFALLSCVRINFMPILQNGYCLYLILLPLITTWVFIIQKYNSIICEKLNIKHQLVISLVLISFMVFVFNVSLKNVHYIPVNTNNKGILKAPRELTVPFNNVIEWISINTKETDRVAVLPEGPMINYITNRPALQKYYHLIPNHISALGEDLVVENLSKEMPEYFIINNTEYSTYNKPHICEDFGFEICKFVEKNYSLQVVYTAYSPKGKPHTSKIYKLNN